MKTEAKLQTPNTKLQRSSKIQTPPREPASSGTLARGVVARSKRVWLIVVAAALWTAVSNGQAPPVPAYPAAGGAPPAVDPTTGLPMADPSTRWKDPKWKDPDKVLPEVVYDGVAISEVARDLRKKFNDAFDIVVPNSWQSPKNPTEVTEPGNTPIRLQLKNVSASEVFNAMNLVFEAENTSLAWELKMNGSRPTVLLRVFPSPFTTPPELQMRHIYYVGQLLGDEKAGGMTMEQLVKTISEVYEMSYGSSQGPISNHLQFHKQAQLLVATGTPTEIDFVQQTLDALRQRIDYRPKEPPKPEAPPARSKGFYEIV